MVIIGLTIIIPTMRLPTFDSQTALIASASDETFEWNITLRITETSGTGNTVIFGEKSDASDDLDRYDLPEPPAPPQLPFIRAWFITSFKIPFNNLLQEYKSSSSDQAIWNLSLVRVASPGNLSNMTITIRWDPIFINENFTPSLLLSQNNVIIANMITQNSYSFPTNGSVHNFKIIYERKIINNNGKPLDIPILPLIITGIIFIILITTTIFFAKRKKN